MCGRDYLPARDAARPHLPGDRATEKDDLMLHRIVRDPVRRAGWWRDRRSTRRPAMAVPLDGVREISVAARATEHHDLAPVGIERERAIRARHDVAETAPHRRFELAVARTAVVIDRIAEIAFLASDRIGNRVAV